MWRREFPAPRSPKVQRLLERSETVRLVSPVSFNEIAIKANRGLTPLAREHIEKLIVDLDLTVLPLTPSIPSGCLDFQLNHGDPFDRTLIATALAGDIAIVASDREFRKYKGLRVIW